MSDEPEEPLPKSNRAVRLALLALAVVAIVGVWQAVGGSGPAEVVYNVTGSAKVADVTYSTASGDTAQQNGVDVPMVSKTTGRPGIRTTMDSGSYLYISAQNQGQSGDISCSITADGVELAANTSRGAYAIVTCSARVP